MRQFRTIKTVGQVREFRAIEADRLRTDPDEPRMKRPDAVIFAGSWGDFNKSRLGRDRKAPRLNARRAARQYRQQERDRLTQQMENAN